MRPRTDVSPMRRDGSLISGVLKDALTSMRVSLTCGRMWRTLPASHIAPVGACACTGCASNSADMPKPNAAADDDFKNSRLSITPLHRSRFARANYQTISTCGDRHRGYVCNGARPCREQMQQRVVKNAPRGRAPRLLLQRVALVLEHPPGKVVEGGGDRARLQPVVVRFARKRGIDRLDSTD